MEKRVDKGFLIPLLGLLAVFLVISVFEYTKQQGISAQDSEVNEKLPAELGSLSPGEGQDNQFLEQESGNNGGAETPKNASVGGGGSGTGGSSGGGGSDEGDTEEESEDLEEVQEKLPYDLHTAPCGVYFEKYGICAGSCPDGACVSEGRSCYCKIL
jgi:hypothetical protein